MKDHIFDPVGLPQGKDSFYIKPAVQHYRCWRIYVANTKCTRIFDTIAWLSEPYRMPGHCPLEELTAATADLLAAVKATTTCNQALLRQYAVGPGEHLGQAVLLLRDLYTQL
jgi:hypothetical protein